MYIFVASHFPCVFLCDTFLPTISASGKKALEHAMENWETKVQHEAL